MQTIVGEDEEGIERSQSRRDVSWETVARRCVPARSAGEVGEKARDVTPSR